MKQKLLFSILALVAMGCGRQESNNSVTQLSNDVCNTATFYVTDVAYSHNVMNDYYPVNAPEYYQKASKILADTLRAKGYKKVEITPSRADKKPNSYYFGIFGEIDAIFEENGSISVPAPFIKGNSGIVFSYNKNDLNLWRGFVSVVNLWWNDEVTVATKAFEDAVPKIPSCQSLALTDTLQ